jgi:hypothetical protein
MTSKTESCSNILSEWNAITWEYNYTEELLEKVIRGELIMLDHHKEHLLERAKWLSERYTYLLNNLKELKKNDVWVLRGS